MTCKFIDSSSPGFSYYHFTEEGFSCKIVPAFGGSIQELIVDGKPIIEGTTPDKPGYEKYLQYCLSALLFPFPNRIKEGTYTFEGSTYALAVNEAQYQNAIHGIVFNKPFEAVSTNNSLKLQYSHHESPGFPFPFIFNVTYTFSSRSVQMEIHVQNTGETTFPFGVGWHPYFISELQGNTRIHFSSDKKYEVNESMIPYRAENTEEKVFDLAHAFVDNAFRLTDSTIIFATDAYQLTMRVPEDNYLQLYTPPNRSSIAIEPMSCISNAFNNGIGLRTLPAGNEFKWMVQLEIEIN